MFKFIYLYRTLLVLVILASILAIITNGTALLQGPAASEQPHSADWVSAISTFWGAVAGGLGAIGTAGALLIAARTYDRQVRDRRNELAEKRREAAEAVTVDIDDVTGVLTVGGSGKNKLKRIEVRNDGNRAVFGIALVLLDKTLKEVYQEPFSSVPPQDARGFVRQEAIIGGAYATFTDGAGVRWKRWHNGDLIEIPHYPTVTSTPEALR